MPLDFVYFWKLIWTRKQTNLQLLKSKSKANNPFAAGAVKNEGAASNSDQNMLEVYRWKLSFDSYGSNMPQYYNDYLNSYLKFL